MSSNQQLEPGDLAIVIKSVDNAAIGKIVTCIQIDGTHSKYGTIWLVESSTPIATEYGGVGNRVHMAQDWLRKIPKDPLPDEEDDIVLDNVKDKQLDLVE